MLGPRHEDSKLPCALVLHTDLSTIKAGAARLWCGCERVVMGMVQLDMACHVELMT
jgi:hypothetical protein